MRALASISPKSMVCQLDTLGWIDVKRTHIDSKVIVDEDSVQKLEHSEARGLSQYR